MEGVIFMKKISGIYKITNKANGKNYIGQSTNLQARRADHKRRLATGKHDNEHLQNAWNQYGSCNFEFSIIEECEYNFNILNDREKYWIDRFDALNRNKGYNIASGGGNSFSLAGKSPDEIKEVYRKITNARLKKWEELGNPRKGFKMSDEQKEYLSLINTGPKHPLYGKKRPEHSKKMSGSNSPTARKVRCITTNEIFGCAKDAGEKYNTTNSNILKCCKQRQRSAGRLKDGTKLVWEYVND